MNSAPLQLFLFGPPEVAEKRSPHLAEPLTREEQREYGKRYAANVRLVRKFAARLRQQYGHCLAPEDINSCADLAFLKACRAWDPERGAFSTIFWRLAEGEVKHWLRGDNWGVSATHKARELGIQAQRLLGAGMGAVEVCRELNCSTDDLQDALVAVTGIAHDTMGFDLHACDKATPYEDAEQQELKRLGKEAWELFNRGVRPDELSRRLGRSKAELCDAMAAVL